MALAILYETASGVDGTYWRCEDISWRFSTGELSAVLAVYLDETSASTGKVPLERHTFAWSPEERAAFDEPDGVDEILAAVYDALKSMPMFDGAVDA